MTITQARQNIMQVSIALKDHAEGLGVNHHFYNELQDYLKKLDEITEYLFAEEN